MAREYDWLNKPSKSRDRKSRQDKPINEDHEDTVARKLGGKRTPGSGNSWRAKGDVSCDKVLVENKATSKNSISIKQEWLVKITQEAIATRKTPALAIRFTEAQLCEKDWVCIPLSDYEALTQS